PCGGRAGARLRASRGPGGRGDGLRGARGAGPRRTRPPRTRRLARRGGGGRPVRRGGAPLSRGGARRGRLARRPRRNPARGRRPAAVSGPSADGPALPTALRAGAGAPRPTATGLRLGAAPHSQPAGDAALYALKGRPRSQACQVLVLSPGLLDEALAPLEDVLRRAARALLPGPATCLLPDPVGRYLAAAGAEPGRVGLRAPDVRGALA